MKSGSQTLFIGVLTGLLLISVLACPVWMSSLSHGNMPCPNEGSSQHCPATICQLSSPYLTASVNAHAPLLKELPAKLIISPVLTISLGIAEPTQQEDAAPPGLSGPLFIQTHSLLI
jgi:hypothetical protein